MLKIVAYNTGFARKLELSNHSLVKIDLSSPDFWDHWLCKGDECKKDL